MDMPYFKDVCKESKHTEFVQNDDNLLNSIDNGNDGLSIFPIFGYHGGFRIQQFNWWLRHGSSWL